MAQNTTTNNKTNKEADRRANRKGVPTKMQETASEVMQASNTTYIGIDVHLKRYVFCRKEGGRTAQPAQGMSPEAFLRWIEGQKSKASRLVCCYEAGPFGYTLARKLRAMGIECQVIRPQDWDKYGKRVKTDRRDATAMVEALALYDGGNRRALSIVRIPTEEQEQQRMVSRQREAMVREMKRLASVGRSYALSQGHEIRGKWWAQRQWSVLEKQLPQWLVAILENTRRALLTIEELVEKLTEKIESRARPASGRPKALGKLTEQVIDNEVGDWKRFNNRRQVGSYAGLCPRLRTALIEATWRLIRRQPEWWRWKRLQEKAAQAGKGWRFGRKQMVVALARGLVVDLWRLYTGRCTLPDLGLVPAAHKD
jgi:transposase